MWRYVDYMPVTAFGLRPSNTTSNGGKTLICPTPYAIKMALLDRLLTNDGEDAGRRLFPFIRDLPFHIRVPEAVSVNRTFQKVLRLAASPDEMWTQSISQREYGFHCGMLTLALPLTDQVDAENRLSRLFTEINAFGRRGSFFQWMGERFDKSAPEEPFVAAHRGAIPKLSLGFLQRMDDMLPDATFSDISVFNPKASGARLSYTVIYPYQIKSHGVSFTIYALPGIEER